MEKRSSSRSGFTLIELLVVIAIIAILLGLLVPAVQKVNEIGRRVQCQNQQKNLGVALNAYEIEYQHYPYSFITNGPNHSWISRVLKYLGEKTIYDKYDFSVDWNNGSNQAARFTRIALLECPSAPSNRSWPDGNTALTDFSSVCEPTDEAYNRWIKPNMDQNAPSIYPNKDANAAGIMVWDNMNNGKFVRRSDVTDGLSNTILVIEVAGRPQRWIAGGRPSSDTSLINKGGLWADPNSEIHFNTSDGIDQINGGPYPMNGTSNNEIYSFHWQGANFYFADGSSKYLRDGITNGVMMALISRAGKDNGLAASALD